MALCLGPTGSGKTLLLKKLQNVNSVDKTTPSVATVGTNLFEIRFDDGSQVSVRELGGLMAPLWSNYFSGVKKVIYVVDASNLCQISAAGVLLYTILVHPQLRVAKVNFINKNDTRSKFYYLFTKFRSTLVCFNVSRAGIQYKNSKYILGHICKIACNCD